MQTPEFKELLAGLNPEQQKAVTYNDGPLLIVAGAGTGKTHLVTAKMAYLIMEKNLKTDNILALTFTDKAAQEMEDRVIKLLPYGYVDLWVTTFHSFGERLLRSHGVKVGLAPDFKVLSESQQWLMVFQNLDRFKLKEFYQLSNPTKYISTLIRHFNQAKDELISPAEYIAWADDLLLNKESLDFIKKNIKLDDDIADLEAADLLPEIMKYKELAEAYHVYQKLLQENNAIDFADMIYYAYKLLNENTYLLKKYRSQFKHIIVDEFQDTNYSQYQLVKLLAAPNNNLTVVGDDDQSIYRFRGASIFNILKFKDDYANAQEVVLTKNYRSGQNILDLAYKSIQNNNPYRLEEKLKIDKELHSQVEDSGAVEQYYMASGEEEVSIVIDKIKQLSVESDFNWNDIAILARANSHLEPFMNALQLEGIPYQFMASRGLFNKPIIVDVISYFKLLDNYHESPALYRILTLPFLEIEIEDLITINNHAKANNYSLWQSCQKAAALNVKEETVNKITKLLFLIKKHSKEAVEDSIIKVYLSFLKDTAYLSYLINDVNERKEELLWYLQLFAEKLKDFEINYSDNRLAAFMNIFKMEIESGDKGSLRLNPETGPEFINLMTIHSSKGLEYKWVFLVNLVEQKFPGRYRGEDLPLPEALIKEKGNKKELDLKDVHIQEERRLFYVAVTRAKKKIFLTAAKQYAGRKTVAKLSRFLDECNLNEETPQKKENTKGIFSLDRFTTDLTMNPNLYSSIDQRFSFTKLNDYDQCPYRFWLKYVVKIPTFAAGPSLTFGQVIHSVFHRFLADHQAGSAEQMGLFGEPNDKKTLTFEYLKKLYESYWRDDGYDNERQREEYKERGYKIMKKFWEEFEEQQPNLRDLEKGIKIKLQGWSFILDARFDRVDNIDNDAIEILDYKTGKTKTKLEINDKRQLLIYYLGAKQLYGQYPKKLTYLYVEEWHREPFIPKEKDLQSLISWIDEIVANIRARKFEPCPGFQCQYCPFKDICDFKE